MPPVFAWMFAVILVVVGLAGVVVPMVPGTVLVFAGLLIAAWTDNFTRVSVPTMVAIGVIGAASYAVDFAAAAVGVKRAGASRQAIVGAALGMMLGVFFGLPGVIIGPFAGAVIGELAANRVSADPFSPTNLKRAGRVGLAAWIGFLIGTAVKVAIVFVMLGMFFVALFVP